MLWFKHFIDFPLVSTTVRDLDYVMLSNSDQKLADFWVYYQQLFDDDKNYF